MGKIIKVTESEKKQILTLHETVKTEENYFESIENRIKNILLEKHEGPKLQSGESMTEDGKILSVKTVKKPDLIIEAEANFPPGKWEPFSLDEEQQKKIKDWFSNIKNSDVGIDVKIIAGSSKSGPHSTDEEGRRKFNIDLAGKRATKGIETVKTFLDSVLKPQIASTVNYTTDITGAHQGPEYDPKKNKSSEPQYQPYQFVKIKIHAKGEVTVESRRPVSFMPYRVLPIGNLPNIGFVEFCISGFSTRENGLYSCPNNGWKALYYSNTGDKVTKGTTRWIPIPPADTARGIVWQGSQAESGTGEFANGAMRCFQYETSGKDNERCKSFYDKWPNYSYRWKEGKEGDDWSIPGPEVGDKMYQRVIENWGDTYAQQ
jgi:hypothetical protein